MRKLIHLLLFIALAFAINSCKKHDATSNDIIVPYETGKTITTVVAGKVTDQTGTALNNVQITIGTTTVTTDVNGSFIIPKATLGEKSGFIKATKDGYFSGSRIIMPKEKVINNILIQLVKKTQSGSFTNASGGTITIATGGKIEFPASAVTLKNGGAYTGTVKVSAYFLDPTSKDCYKEMPGDLRGINTTNNEQVLTSYGMMAVELQGSNGEALQLATGKTATVTFPIVAATQSKAPATIPLWFFDETKGMWAEQGSATKVGNNYIGTVSHFTWWNTDLPTTSVNYKIKFLDQNGNPIQNGLVVLTRTTNTTWATTDGITASDGTVSGIVPANEVMKMTFFCSTVCSADSFQLPNIGPFTQDADGGIINVTLHNANIVDIIGTVFDCNNIPVDGFAVININNTNYNGYVSNGILNSTIIFCSAVPLCTATVDVFDIVTLKKNTTPISINITSAGTFNIGQITTCGVQALIRYTATLVDQSGRPLSDYSGISFGLDSVFYGRVQPFGKVEQLLPANKAILRRTYPSAYCVGSLKMADSTIIGPFSSNFDAGTIVITLPQAAIPFTISGTAKDCNNNPISNGTAYIQLGGATNSATISNGNFSSSVYLCDANNNTATVSVVDNLGQQNTTPITVATSYTNANIGQVNTCQTTHGGYFIYNFKGKTITNDSIGVFATPTLTTLYGASSTDGLSFNANFNDTLIGFHQVNLRLTDNNGKLYETDTTNNSSWRVNEYGSIGQYVSGVFYNTVKEVGTNIIYQVVGSFSIKRTQ